MKWLLIVVTALVLPAAIVALVGWRIPRGHSASRQARFAAPPEIVWRAITDWQAFPTWRAGVRSVAPHSDESGRSGWIEDTSTGRIPLVIDRSEPPHLLVLRIADSARPFGGTWTYRIASLPAGSSLTITEDGEIYNPVFRFMARFIFGYDATMAAYLASLEKHLATR